MKTISVVLCVAVVACGGGSSNLKVAGPPSDSAVNTTDSTPPSDSSSPSDSGTPRQPAVRITELHYHPITETTYDDVHEFIELHNAGEVAAELEGWALDDGVDYTFEARTLSPGETLVVALNREALLAVFPALDPSLVVGNWTGGLSNGGERVELVDALGETVDEVTYGDTAPWPVGADALGVGAAWLSDEVLPLVDHEGMGRSLQRVSLQADSDDPGNWVASPLDGMDPGGVAGMADRSMAVVTEVSWGEGVGGPLSPGAEVRVEVVASRAIASARLEWFVEDLSATGETVGEVPLADDGTDGDLVANDGRYTAVLPPQAEGAVLRVRVLGDGGLGDGVVSPRAGDPYAWHSRFVGASIEGDTRPYRLFINETDWTLLWDHAQGGRVSECDASEGWAARVPAVFVYDGTVHDVFVRYQGSRWNRTNGADIWSWTGSAPERPSPPKALSWSVKFPRYAPLDGRTRISLNKLTQSCPGTTTVVGFQLFEAAGMPVPMTRYARLFVNGSYYNYMLEVESPGDDMLERWMADHAPDEPGVPHLFKSGGCNCDEGPYGWGDERPLASSCGHSALERYAATYERKTWDFAGHTELQVLIEGLDVARAGSDAELRSFLDENFDVDAVLAYMAVMNWSVPFDDMFQNHYLLQRRSDGRWLMAPWDLDLDFGGWKGASASIYMGEEGNLDNRSGWWNRIKDAFLQVHRDAFNAKLRELNETVLHPDRVVPLVDANEATWSLSEVEATPAGPYCDFTVGAESFRTFARQRHDVVAAALAE